MTPAGMYRDLAPPTDGSRHKNAAIHKDLVYSSIVLFSSGFCSACVGGRVEQLSDICRYMCTRMSFQ